MVIGSKPNMIQQEYYRSNEFKMGERWILSNSFF